MMNILIKSAGDLASGVAVRLYHCGFRIVMTEIEQPTTVRCEVAFSRAVYLGACSVEGVGAELARDAAAIDAILARGHIAVFTGPQQALLRAFPPDAVIDAIIAKHNTGTTITDAPLVIALGPGFQAGVDCHAVIETMRGHDLGRVIYQGQALPDTGVPGDIAGYGRERLLRSPHQGVFTPVKRIGDTARKGDIVALVDGAPVHAHVDGVIRGLLPAGTPVYAGMKSGDIDPRGTRAYCFTVSDKARAIAGGVLEALLHLRQKNG